MKKELFYKDLGESGLELQAFLKAHNEKFNELYHINDSYRTNNKIRKMSSQKARYYQNKVNIDDYIDFLNQFNTYFNKQMEILETIKEDPFVQYE